MNWGGLSGCGFTYNKKKKYYKAKKIVIETPIQGKNNKEGPGDKAVQPQGQARQARTYGPEI